MHTELSMEQLFDLFMEVGFSCQFVTEITKEMKNPGALLSIQAPYGHGEFITTVSVMDRKIPTNSYLFNLNTRKFLKSGCYELRDVP